MHLKKSIIETDYKNNAQKILRKSRNNREQCKRTLYDQRKHEVKAKQLELSWKRLVNTLNYLTVAPNYHSVQ